MKTAEKERIAAELISLVPVLHKMTFRCRHEDLDVPPKQMQVLMELAFCDAQNMTQLTERVLVSKQQLTQVVDGLVEKGLVVREGSEENRRLVFIRLTDAGRATLERLVRRQSEAFEAMFVGFSEEEKDIVARAVGLMRRAIQQKLALETVCAETRAKA